MKITNLQNKSTTYKMVLASILAIIGYIINMFEIPYIVPFLRIDLSEVVVLFAVIILGLPYAIAISFIKMILFALSGSNGSEIIGLSVLLLSSVFLASTFHIFLNKLKLNIYISLIVTSILFAITFTTLNYFIIVPLYSGVSFSEINQPGYLKATFSLYGPFNLIKMTIISIVLLILNKYLIKE